MEILDKYGWWTVLNKTVHRKGANRAVLCRCRCGAEQEVRLQHLRSGASQSCGCRRAYVTRQVKTIHGRTGTPLYKCWYNMRLRCEDPTNGGYARYGGEGILICDEWHDFTVFRKWAESHGYEDGLTLDRTDNDGDYEPSNCRWVSLQENLRNTSRAIRVTAWGEEKHLAEWVEDPRCTVGYNVLKARLKDLNWNPERAISTPLLTRGGKPR